MQELAIVAARAGAALPELSAVSGRRRGSSSRRFSPPLSTVNFSSLVSSEVAMLERAALDFASEALPARQLFLLLNGEPLPLPESGGGRSGS